MLTATYTLVALSVEHASVRLSLLAFQKYVRSTLMQQNCMTLSQLEYACENLNSLYQACHWRKTEMYLIPALRETTERADHLLDELNRLNQSALTSIRLLQDKLGSLADVRDEQVSLVCESIETFCTSLLQRLEKEEQELFAIARAAIAGETWFSIANQLMMHDKHLEEMKRAGVAVVDPAHPDPAAQGKRAERAPAGRDGQISIPGLQVLPIVDIDGTDGAQAPAARPRRAREQPFDDAITK
jgi:hemerythrin-like domain-containing protein